MAGLKLTVAADDPKEDLARTGGGGGRSRWEDVPQFLSNLKPGQAVRIRWADLEVKPDAEQKVKSKIRFSLVNYLKNKGYREDFEVVNVIDGLKIRRRPTPLKPLPKK